MTFLDYYNEISGAVFPEGEAENLILKHKLAVKDALIDLQKKVPCLRMVNTDFYCADGSIFHCGATVLPDVEGAIERVCTVPVGATCGEIEYVYVDPDRMRTLIAGYQCCATDEGVTAYPLASCGSPKTPPSFASHTSYTDKGYRAGAGRAFWSKVRGDIWLYPYIESTEQAAIEWSGIRRVWTDATIMPDTLTTREVVAAVELYLSAEVDRFETKNTTSYQINAALYRDAVSQQVFECRQKQTHIRPMAGTPRESC